MYALTTCSSPLEGLHDAPGPAGCYTLPDVFFKCYQISPSILTRPLNLTSAQRSKNKQRWIRTHFGQRQRWKDKKKCGCHVGHSASLTRAFAYVRMRHRNQSYITDPTFASLQSFFWFRRNKALINYPFRIHRQKSKNFKLGIAKYNKT